MTNKELLQQLCSQLEADLSEYSVPKTKHSITLVSELRPYNRLTEAQGDWAVEIHYDETAIVRVIFPIAMRETPADAEERHCLLAIEILFRVGVKQLKEEMISLRIK